MVGEYNRDISRRKALHKRRIDRLTQGHYSGRDYYDNLHQYSKNKIHCSCPLCAAKTNSKYVHGGKFNGKNPCLRDRKALESMSQQMEEYENEAAF